MGLAYQQKTLTSQDTWAHYHNLKTYLVFVGQILKTLDWTQMHVKFILLYYIQLQIREYQTNQLYLLENI